MQHGAKKVKMECPNKGFFKGNIERRYDHDWLHEQFAFYDRPLNEAIRRNLDSPLCSKSLWGKLSKEDKVKCALEELHVLTAERYIFVKKRMPWKHAIVKMLKQMIVSSTRGWFNLFLIENFEELLTSEIDRFIQRCVCINGRGFDVFR